MTSSMQLQRNHFPTNRSVPASRTCRFCFRAFSKAEHLSRHERSHTKERPYRCKTCGKCYSRNDTLIRHGKVHNKVKGEIKQSTRRKASPTSSGKSGAATTTLVDLQILTDPGQGIPESTTSSNEVLSDASAIDPTLKNIQQGQPADLIMDSFLSDCSLGESMYDAPRNSVNDAFSFPARPELCDIEAEAHYPPWHLEDDFHLQAFNNSLLAPISVDGSALLPSRQESLVVTPKADPHTPISMNFDEMSRKHDSPSYSVASTTPTTISSTNGTDDQFRDDMFQRMRPQWKEDPPPSTDFIVWDVETPQGYLSTVSEPGTPTLYHQVLPNFPYPPCTYFPSQ